MNASMVSFSERLMLKDFLALNWRGSGAVIEIGAFAGSSAIAILQGMRTTGHPGLLHVYDTFVFPKNDLEPIYRHLLPLHKGDSFRGAFDFETREWTKRLAVHEGDAAKAKWTLGPIEFMHIDCSISLAFHEAVALEFYPHLIEGSTVAHQDYDYARAPFIAQMMTKLEPWFKSFCHVETTKYFRCLKTPSREELSAVFVAKEAQAA